MRRPRGDSSRTPPTTTTRSSTDPACPAPHGLTEHAPAARRPRTTCGCTSRGTPPTRTPTSRSSCGARAPTSTTRRASATSTGSRGCSSASSATAAPSSPRPPPSRPPSWPSFPLWSYAHPNAIELAERIAGYAPGDLNRVFFTTGGGEAVETAWKLAKNYFKLDRQADEAQGDQPRRSPTTAPPRARCRSPGCRRSSSSSSRWCPRRSGCRTPTSTAPPLHGGRPRGLRPLGRRPDRGRHRERGPRHRRRRLPGAGAERRRLLPAAAGLLPAGPRDLRRVRRAARLRRGDLRLRPARPHVRRRAVRLPARHDHLRQGAHLRLRPARRDDRDRPADGAVPARATSRSPTATPSAATRSPPRWRMANLDVFEARGHQRARPRERGRVPGDAGEAAATCRSSATSAATGYFYGIELVKDKETKETFDDEESERLLRGFLSRALFDAGPLLPRRRPRRPGRPARAAADLRPGALRRDGADPPRRARQGVVDAVKHHPAGGTFGWPPLGVARLRFPGHLQAAGSAPGR